VTVARPDSKLGPVRTRSTLRRSAGAATVGCHGPRRRPLKSESSKSGPDISCWRRSGDAHVSMFKFGVVARGAAPASAPGPRLNDSRPDPNPSRRSVSAPPRAAGCAEPPGRHCDGPPPYGRTRRPPSATVTSPGRLPARGPGRAGRPPGSRRAVLGGDADGAAPGILGPGGGGGGRGPGPGVARRNPSHAYCREDIIYIYIYE
jgi:hypothetical protein